MMKADVTVDVQQGWITPVPDPARKAGTGPGDRLRLKNVKKKNTTGDTVSDEEG